MAQHNDDILGNDAINCNLGCMCQPTYIKIYKGYSTYFNGKHLIHIGITGIYSELERTYKFIIGNVVKTYENVTTDFFVDLTAEETGSLNLGPINGTIIAVDDQGNETPLTTSIPFIVENWVQGDIDVEQIDITITVKDGDVNNYVINLKSPYFETILHNDLQRRDAENCHPIGAITGLQDALNDKQDVISDLETIRSGAALGATALQQNALNDTALTGNTTAESLKIGGYYALTSNSSLNGGKLSEKSVQKTALAQGIQNSLDKADSAVQTITTGTERGTINVDGVNVPVNGLGTAAYLPATAFDSAGSAQTAETNAKNYADSLATNYATAEQGAKADTAIQPNDNVSRLTNDKNYQTNTQVASSIESHNTSNTAHNDIRNAISNETTNRQNADASLQRQIDAITASSDVTDIVGTYAELIAYDTTSLLPNSIIKVLQDENMDGATTYYRWVVSGGTGTWVLIGQEGPYYTKSEADAEFVPQTRTINGKPLSNDITLDPSDVGAQAILTQGDGIDITNNTISNSGVRSVATGSTNGTISVNTNGESAEVPVAGLKSAAFAETTAFATDAQGSLADSAIQSVITGTTNGTINVDGTDIPVYGLGSAAFTPSTNYATAAQGSKADSALQSGDNVSELNNDAGYLKQSDLSGYQTTSNLVTSVSSASTDSQYPSAKLFFDTIGDVETLINAL